MNVQLNSDPLEPKTFKKAMKLQDKEYWTESARREANNFIKRKAWKRVLKSEVYQKGRRPIPCKWIFKRKNKPDKWLSYKSRIVVKGYMQIPGVDYTESFSPVAGDTVIQTGLSIILYYTNQSTLQGTEAWICVT